MCPDIPNTINQTKKSHQPIVANDRKVANAENLSSPDEHRQQIKIRSARIGIIIPMKIMVSMAPQASENTHMAQMIWIREYTPIRV